MRIVAPIPNKSCSQGKICQKQKKNARQFYTLFKQKFLNVRPLLSIIFPQGFRKYKKFGHWTSGSGGKKTFKLSEEMKEKICIKKKFRCGDFTPFMSKSFQIWDHFFPLLSLKMSESLKKKFKTVKRYLKSELIHRQTHTHTHIWTNRLIESMGPEGQCFEKNIQVWTHWKYWLGWHPVGLPVWLPAKPSHYFQCVEISIFSFYNGFVLFKNIVPIEIPIKIPIKIPLKIHIKIHIQIPIKILIKIPITIFLDKKQKSHGTIRSIISMIIGLETHYIQNELIYINSLLRSSVLYAA